MRLKKIILFLPVMLMFTACAKNILDGLANTSSDDAYIYAAIKYMDAKEYDTAISYLVNKVSATRQNENQVKRLTAEAYAGKCGLDALTFITAIGSSGASALFKIFMVPMVGVSFDSSSCITATKKMVEIGTITTRTNTDNVFLTILSMARLGGSIRSVLDKTPAVGDGTLEDTSCNMTDAQVDQVILSLGYLLENVSAVSASLVGGTSLQSISDLKAACTAVGTNCEITDPTIITGAMRTVFRNLMNTVEFGVGVKVTGGNPALIALACP